MAGAARDAPAQLEPIAGMVKLHCGEPPRCRAVCYGAPVPRRDRQSRKVQARCGILPRLSFTRGIVIVQPPQVEHHRWAPSDLEPKEHGLIPLDASTRALLRKMHWRKSPRDRRQVWLALIVAVLLHAVFMVVIWREMRPPLIADTAHAPAEEALQIRFIDSTPPPAAAPLLQAPPPPSLPSKHTIAPRTPPPPPPRKPQPVAKDAMVIQSPPKPIASASLFDKDGQPLLPSAAPAPATSAPGYVQRTPQGDTAIMHHDNSIKYQSTRFEGDWAKGNTVDQALQKVVDKATIKKTIRLPGGVRVHCAVFLLFGGCGGEAPSPPSAKDGDERLSMAPAKSLAPDPHPPTPPSVEACIALYRAGKPLTWGCPIDTPNRAIDEEKSERAEPAHAHS